MRRLWAVLYKGKLNNNFLRYWYFIELKQVGIYYFNTVSESSCKKLILGQSKKGMHYNEHALHVHEGVCQIIQKKKIPFCFMVTQLLYVKSKAIQQPYLVPVKISCLSITLSAVSCDEGLTFSCSLPSFCSAFCRNEAHGVIKTHMLRMKDLDNSWKRKLTWQPEMKMLYLVRGQTWQKRDFKHLNSNIIYTAVLDVKLHSPITV